MLLTLGVGSASAVDPEGGPASSLSRTVSGTIVLPPNVSENDVANFWARLSIEASPVGEVTEKCPAGILDFNSEEGFPTAENPNWSISDLGPCVYKVQLRSEIYYVGDVETLVLGQVPKIDLRSGDKAGLTNDSWRGVVRFMYGYGVQNTGESALINDYTGKATDFEQFSDDGDWSWRGTAVEPGRYKLKLKSRIGIRYYDGTPRGTADVTKATVIEVAPLSQTTLRAIDPGHWARLNNIPWFSDVKIKGDKFSEDIRWMYDLDVATGTRMPNGTVQFRPKSQVSREAVIAYLYRLNAPFWNGAHDPSPFVDVRPGHKFYKEIMWAHQNGLTTGIQQKDGARKFDGAAPITREAMSAFLYRMYQWRVTDGTGQASFVDVPKRHQFAKEIRWMAENNVTTGIRGVDGRVGFSPKGFTTREATAAFLHRAEREAAEESGQ